MHALILAGGAGARFGGAKLSAPWRDGVLLDGALRTALAAPVAGVAVVTGADAEAVRAAVAGRARIIHADDHAEGIAASLRAGVAALPPEAEGVVVFLGDMPLVSPAVAGRLIAALRRGGVAAAPFHKGRRGHPVAFARALFPDLLTLKGDRGARHLLNALGEDLIRVEADDEGVLVDVDRPADLPS